MGSGICVYRSTRRRHRSFPRMDGSLRAVENDSWNIATATDYQKLLPVLFRATREGPLLWKSHYDA